LRFKSILPSARLALWFLVCFLLLYGLACSALFVEYVNPSFHGGNDLNIGADSGTYLTAARATTDGNLGIIGVIPTLISFQGQYLGPVLIAAFLGTTTRIAIFNGFLFVLGIWIASRLPNVRALPFFLLLILNPTTTASILTLNKEILAYISTILFIRYLTSQQRSKFILFLALVFALGARWEQCAIFIIFLLVKHRWSFLRKHHGATLLFMIAGITILWPILVHSGVVDMTSLLSTAQGAQSHSLSILNSIQSSFGFPVVLIPKMFADMFGVSWNPFYLIGLIFSGDFTDFQNNFISPVQNLAMMFVVLLAVWRHVFNLKKETVFLMTMYLIMSATAPIYQPRYQYPIYVLLCLEITGLISPMGNTSNEKRGRKRGVLLAAGAPSVTNFT
jgi:hypothetical protein